MKSLPPELLLSIIEYANDSLRVISQVSRSLRAICLPLVLQSLRVSPKNIWPLLIMLAHNPSCGHAVRRLRITWTYEHQFLSKQGHKKGKLLDEDLGIENRNSMNEEKKKQCSKEEDRSELAGDQDDIRLLVSKGQTIGIGDADMNFLHERNSNDYRTYETSFALQVLLLLNMLPELDMLDLGFCGYDSNVTYTPSSYDSFVDRLQPLLTGDLDLCPAALKSITRLFMEALTADMVSYLECEDLSEWDESGNHLDLYYAHIYLESFAVFLPLPRLDGILGIGIHDYLGPRGLSSAPITQSITTIQLLESRFDDLSKLLCLTPNLRYLEIDWTEYIYGDIDGAIAFRPSHLGEALLYVKNTLETLIVSIVYDEERWETDFSDGYSIGSLKEFTKLDYLDMDMLYLTGDDMDSGDEEQNAETWLQQSLVEALPVSLVTLKGKNGVFYCEEEDQVRGLINPMNGFVHLKHIDIRYIGHTNEELLQEVRDCGIHVCCNV